MKSLKYLLLLLLVVGFTFQSCKNDEDNGGGDPTIKYIRITDPTQQDSLLVEASMGNLIAIVGENLANVKEVWFNDQEALVTPTYVTNNSILVNIPNLPPQEINDKITLVLKDGRAFQFDFTVTIPAPVISGIKCEYVNDGDTAEIYGNYFFSPQVIFPGDLSGEIVSVTQQSILVKVPTGAQKGQIQVKTKFGKINSKFQFRDDNGVFLDFDGKLGAGWHWHPEHRQSSNPTAISGNYYKFDDSDLDPDDWNDAKLECDLWGQLAGRPEGPLWEGGTFGKVLKFEVFVSKSWQGGFMQFIFIPWNNNNNNAHTNNAFVKGIWSPWLNKKDKIATPYKTDGWITVSMPLSDFKYDGNGNDLGSALVYPDNCGSLAIFIRGPEKNTALYQDLVLYQDPNPILIYIDNIRISDL